MLGVVPHGALRSARQLRAITAPGGPGLPPGSRLRLFASSLVVFAVLLGAAWWAGTEYGWSPFARPPLDRTDMMAGAAVLALGVLSLLVSRTLRSAAERRAMPINSVAPRGSAEWAMFVLVAAAASVVEEIVYRGMAVAVLSPLLGTFGAILVSAVAFSVAHAVQQWKSMVVVFFMALAMHALVAVTGTLVIAMVVHFIYDLIAGAAATRQAAEFSPGPARQPGAGE